MIGLTSLLLLVISATLLWFNRPTTPWSGAAAARFAAGLITFLYALLAPWPKTELHTTQLLLEQLSFYAALPLLLSVALATHLGYIWSRMIWGRVLLAWCVVFELSRSNNVLAELLTALLVIGSVLFFWFVLQPKHLPKRRVALLCLAWLGMATLAHMAMLSNSLLLFLSLLLLFIHEHLDPVRENPIE